MSGVSGVPRRPLGAGVAPTRDTEVLADRLPHDHTPCVQDSGHDRGIHLGHVSFEDGGAARHRDSREADVVLEDHCSPGQRTLGRTLDGRLHVPGPVPVLVARRPVARLARIPDLGQVVRHLIDRLVRREDVRHKLAELTEVGVRQVQAELTRDFPHIRQAWSFEGHPISPFSRSSRMRRRPRSVRPHARYLPGGRGLPSTCARHSPWRGGPAGTA